MFVNKYPFFHGYGPKNVFKVKAVVEAWDAIKSAGGHPYECSSAMITMQLVNFKKFFAGKEVAVSRNGRFTVYSMWHKNGTEICAQFEDEKEEFIKLD